MESDHEKINISKTLLYKTNMIINVPRPVQ